jgi:AcrR family transcriptional regulator
VNIHSVFGAALTQTDKRQEILQATLRLIAEQGFHEAPVARVAEQAGVGAGTIYRYFANKELLITELFQEIHARISAAMLDGYQEDKPIRERFLHLGTAVLRYFIANPLEFRFIQQYMNSPYGIAFRRDRIMGKGADGDLYRRLLEEGVAQQIIKGLPLTVLLSLAIGPLLALARDQIAGFVELDEGLLGQAVEACWDGLKR